MLRGVQMPSYFTHNGAVARDLSAFEKQNLGGPSIGNHLTGVRPASDLAGNSAVIGGNLSLIGDERWFLVHSLPKKERQAKAHLEMQGFRTYVPMCMKTVRHARKMRTVKAPLFPRYFFVIVDLGRDRWLSIRSTLGVSYLVGREDCPSPVPQGIVEGLIDRTDKTELVSFVDSFKKGQKVKVTNGPFVDLVGTLQHLDDAGRVRVLLNMMGSAVVVRLHQSGILPAS